MPDTSQQFAKPTVFFHWLVAISIISMMCVGTYMHEFKAYNLYPIHKSIGVIILIPILLRIIWRLKNGWPTPVGQYSNIEHIVAKIIHWILLLGTLLFPLSGMMMSGAGGNGIAIFGLELVAGNYDAAGKAIAINAEAAGIGHNIHGLLAKVFIAAIILHVAGALKHHIIDKDGTLRRMLGKTI